MTAEQAPPEPTPTGLAPLAEATIRSDGEVLEFVLELDATQAEPALENLFLAKGGTLAGAAARGATRFAVTGSPEAVVHKLSDNYSTTVRIPLPEGMAVPSTDKPLTLDVDNRAKMLVTAHARRRGDQRHAGQDRVGPRRHLPRQHAARLGGQRDGGAHPTPTGSRTRRWWPRPTCA